MLGNLWGILGVKQLSIIIQKAMQNLLEIRLVLVSVLKHPFQCIINPCEPIASISTSLCIPSKGGKFIFHLPCVGGWTGELFDGPLPETLTSGYPVIKFTPRSLTRSLTILLKFCLFEGS